MIVTINNIDMVIHNINVFYCISSPPPPLKSLFVSMFRYFPSGGTLKDEEFPPCGTWHETFYENLNSLLVDRFFLSKISFFWLVKMLRIVYVLH